jgi:hypothetical protein
MPSKYFIVNDPNDVVIVILVAVLQIFKDPQLHTRLVLKPLLVSNDFDRHKLLLFVVKTLQSLPKTSASQLINNLVSES